MDFVGICRVFSGAWTWPPMGSADMVDTGADTQCLMHLVGGMALLKVCKWTKFRVNVAQIWTLYCQIGDCMIRLFATRSLFSTLEFRLQACAMYLVRVKADCKLPLKPPNRWVAIAIYILWALSLIGVYDVYANDNYYMVCKHMYRFIYTLWNQYWDGFIWSHSKRWVKEIWPFKIAGPSFFWVSGLVKYGQIYL